MNRTDRLEFERQLVDKSQKLDDAMRLNKPIETARAREELQQHMRYMNS